MNKQAVQKLRRAIKDAYEAGLELGDPMILYNERYMEYLIADELGHTKDKKTQGADAYDNNGNPVEYKTINADSKGAGCFQFHWNRPDKIEKLKQLDSIFCIKRQGEKIQEVYKLPATIAVQLAEEKYNKPDDNKKGIFDKNGFSFTVKKLLELGGEKIT